MPSLFQLVSLCGAVALAGCATLTDPNDPARDGQTVSLVNSLTWTNPMNGKPDALRSAWPLASLGRHVESFPLAQIKQCDKDGAACAWGVMNASRTIAKPRFVAGGVSVDLELLVDIGRHQEVHRPEYNGAMTIPADVPALSEQRRVKQTLTLAYGKVQHFDAGYGVGYDLCVQRLDAERKLLDKCDIAFH